MPNISHETYMNRALDLAREGLGRVAPNPSVGCVLVKDGIIIAEARTQDGGRPHAEAMALSMAEEGARGATAYVTLEPCSHTGKTPPCAKALIDAGVQTVYVACTDPDPRVSGQGIKMLKDAGIKVNQGLCEAEALALNAGFFKAIVTGMPYVTLKMAVSQDGFVAGAGGETMQISSPECQAYMHQNLRARHDAILVGRQTALNDNPRLTTRFLPDGQAHNPLRFVLSQSNTPLPQDQHVQSLAIAPKGDLKTMLKALYQDHGVTRLLVEGGVKTINAFMAQNMWDQLCILQSQTMQIGAGVPAPDFDTYQIQFTKEETIGTDVLAFYQPQV